MLINIKINKNNIDTAPTYTNKYDSPIKFNPNVIKKQATLKNNVIKNNTDTIGFLVVITNIPDIIDNTDNAFIILML
jgi:hypothetical protein